MWGREWTYEMYRYHPWSELSLNVRKQIARIILAGPRPDSCRCGNTNVCLYSRSGKYLDDPADYYYECRACHKGPQPIKYPGRPKGSRNNKLPVKEKSANWWKEMCADAEKELYGSNSVYKNNI